MMEPTFSLCHATMRVPDGWQKSYKVWLESCDNPDSVEHILSVDGDPEGTLMKWPNPGGIEWPVLSIGVARAAVAFNKGKQGSAPNWNNAARLATGRVLISVSDDWFPCPHWDTELLKVIPDLDGEYVVDVTNGGDADRRGLMLHAIMTRRRYERYGYMWHPDYVSLFADDEYTEVAHRDGVVVNARHLKFPHHHFTVGLSERDAAYDVQNSAANSQHGRDVYYRRRAAGFPALGFCPLAQPSGIFIKDK